MIEHLTFEEFSIEFCSDKALSGKSWRTIQWYHAYFNQFSDWLESQNLGGMKVEEITPSILKSFFSYHSQSHNAGGLHGAYRAIKAILNYYEFVYDPDNWKNPIKKVKISPNRIAPLPEIPLTVVKQLITASKQTRWPERDKAILVTLVDTGVRMSELLDLNVSDINLSVGNVRVNHGKGNKFRLVFLGETGKSVVKNYLDSREVYNPDEPLFLNDEGERLGQQGLRMILQRLSKKANVKYFGPHSYRRLFALTLYRQTRDVLLVSKLCGHSSTEVTKRYLNLTAEDLRDLHQANSPADFLN